MPRSSTRAACLVAIIVLAGCATVQPDSRFPDVQRSVEERLGHDVAWNRISAMDHGRLRPETACAACHFDRIRRDSGAPARPATGRRRGRWPGTAIPRPVRGSASSATSPPSHLMMHFEMMDRMVTGQRDATVDQCYRCHTTDHWNNVKGLGFVKHH